MKLNLISMPSGQSVQVSFCEVMDRKDCSDIRNSPRPVSTALTLATKRLGVEMGLHPAPAPAVALEGLKIEGAV